MDLTDMNHSLDDDVLVIAGHRFGSRLFTGTGKFNDRNSMMQCLTASGSELVTMALKRVDLKNREDDILAPLIAAGFKLLPNTSGARTAEEAVYAAQLAREALGTSWVKLEIHPDSRHLLPDPVETLKAAERLCQQGFTVLPYVHADPVLCRRLEEAGCAAVMPLGAPIGSNKGLLTREFIQLIIEQSQIPVIVDAGIGAPSDASQAMEMGADGVLVNTAMAVSRQPDLMGQAFAFAVRAGRMAFLAGLAAPSDGQASSPLTAFLG